MMKAFVDRWACEMCGRKIIPIENCEKNGADLRVLQNYVKRLGEMRVSKRIS